MVENYVNWHNLLGHKGLRFKKFYRFSGRAVSNGYKDILKQPLPPLIMCFPFSLKTVSVRV